MFLFFREFLTGFRKRKQERKERARKEVEEKLKKEKKQIKTDIKNNFFNQFKKSFAPLPDLEDDDEKKEEEEYEDDQVNVKIVELSTTDLARENNWIGANRGKIQESSAEEEEADDDEPEEAVPGMSIEAPKEKKVAKKKTTQGDKARSEIKSKKELTRMVADRTSKMIKQSKAFKMKSRLDMMKDRRKARSEKRKKIHILKKQSKKRGGKHKKLLRKPKERKRGGRDD